MSSPLKYAISIAGAAALATTVLTNAWASRPSPLHANATKNVTVTGILHANKNMSVYGHLYAHNQLQVWSQLLVRTGGLKVLAGGIRTDALDVAGPLSAQSATVSGVVQGGTLQSLGTITGAGITGTSLS